VQQPYSENVHWLHLTIIPAAISSIYGSAPHAPGLYAFTAISEHAVQPVAYVFVLPSASVAQTGRYSWVQICGRGSVHAVMILVTALLSVALLLDAQPPVTRTSKSIVVYVPGRSNIKEPLID